MENGILKTLAIMAIIAVSANALQSELIIKNKDVEVIETYYQTIVNYDAQGGINQINESIAEHEYYSNGSLQKINSYNSSGELTSKTIYEYYLDGNYYPDFKVKSLSSYNSNGELTNKTEYNFDGNIQSQKGYNSSGELASIIEYEYYSDGKLQSIKIYNLNRELSNSRREYEYEYHSNGYLEKIYYYDSKEELTSRTESEYNSDGRIQNQKNYNSKEELTSRTEYEYEYHSNGYLEKRYNYNSKGELSNRTECEYNSDSRIQSEKNYNSKEELTSRREYEYYSNDYIQKATSYNSSGVKTQETIFVYTYKQINVEYVCSTCCNLCEEEECVCEEAVVCNYCGKTEEECECEEAVVCIYCNKIEEECVCKETSIVNTRKSDNRNGIRFAKNIVYDKAEISINADTEGAGSRATALAIRNAELKIYDMTGNVVFSTSIKGNETISWDLRNSAGRNVANGTYLVIAEVVGASGQRYRYSAKLGVKR